LALPVIVAGNSRGYRNDIGTASLASLVGEGGLGDLIFKNITTQDLDAVLAGGILMALLAIVADLLLLSVRYSSTGTQCCVSRIKGGLKLMNSVLQFISDPRNNFIGQTGDTSNMWPLYYLAIAIGVMLGIAVSRSAFAGLYCNKHQWSHARVRQLQSSCGPYLIFGLGFLPAFVALVILGIPRYCSTRIQVFVYRPRNHDAPKVWA